jgi:hypothetical protein
MKKEEVLIEEFTVQPEQGAVAFMIGLQKPGYTLDKIERMGTKVKVYFVKNKNVSNKEIKRLENMDKALIEIAKLMFIQVKLWDFIVDSVTPKMRAEIPTIEDIQKERVAIIRKIDSLKNDFLKKFSDTSPIDKIDDVLVVREFLKERGVVVDYKLPSHLIDNLKRDISTYLEKERNLTDSLLGWAENL